MGGGGYNIDNIGGEVVNFKNTNGYVYASFSCGPKGLKLERINPNCFSDRLENSTLVFVARKPPEFGNEQVVVGWYKKATIYRNFQSIGKRGWIIAKCKVKDAILLPTYNRNCVIPSGEGSIGQKNISYLYSHIGKFYKTKWFETVTEFVNNYDGPNILHSREEELQSSKTLEEQLELINSASQGFSIDPKTRKYVELNAMNSAEKYYRNKGYSVINISSRNPCDLLCEKGNQKFYVEVKGSQMPIDKIILTKNEVRFINKNKGRIRLFLKENIRCKKNKAGGGNHREISSFTIKRKNLLSLQYLYSL
ncbi:MAG TPA: hypothetical protein DCE80_17290 [Ignavibacteriales bacterium]|nr:hypothetical protein [Ignavibacteriales bacterium]